MVPGLYAAAELRHHGLLAIADAEHRQPRLEHPIGGTRRAKLGDARRSTGEDHCPRFKPLKRVLGSVEGYDLRVDALLAHAAGDELRYLAAEIDDEDGVGHGAPGLGPGRRRSRCAPVFDRHRQRQRSSWRQLARDQRAALDWLPGAGPRARDARWHCNRGFTPRPRSDHCHCRPALVPAWRRCRAVPRPPAGFATAAPHSACPGSPP